MQLMATMRYLDQLETEMSRDQFEDLVRKVKLAIATRLRTSASGAAVLEDACQVSRYFILLYIITYQTQNTSIYCILLRIACIYYELWGDSQIFRAQEAVADGADSVLPEHSLHHQLQQENVPEPTVSDSSLLGPGTNPVHYPLGSVSSLLMNSKGEEIIYPVEDDRDRIWARRLEWVVDQHLDRAEDEQKQLQRDFEAVLRQSKEARERKYDQATISYLSKQLDTARETIWALRR